jgi:hypothetical protein
LLTPQKSWWIWQMKLEVEQLTFGGGLGVAYVETEHASTITEWSTHLISAAEQLRKPHKCLWSLVAPLLLPLQ